MHSFLNPGKFTLSKAALFAIALAPISLHATPITYSLTLTPGAGSLYGGTGSITFEDAPATSGISDYTVSNGTLENLNFTIDNQTFTLAGATGNTLVRFLNGQLNDITFAETFGGSNRFTLDTTAGYAFYYNNGQAASYGSMLASPAVSPAATTSSVSEPASLVFFGTGLFLSIGLLYRTHSPHFTSKVHLPKA